MIIIKKRPEPKELLKYRKQPLSTYGDMPSDVKSVVKRHLVEEQGGLCAYCMSRLPKGGTYGYTGDAVTIEHWAPQNPATRESGHDALDYRNMLAVCRGNRGSGNRRFMTCDAARGNAPIIVNPLEWVTLAEIYYTARGEIRSSNAVIDRDLNDVLNLNCDAASLPERRKAALDQLRASITKRYAGKVATKAGLQKLLEDLEAEVNPKTEFAGILIWWLKRRLAR